MRKIVLYILCTTLFSCQVSHEIQGMYHHENENIDNSKIEFFSKGTFNYTPFKAGMSIKENTEGFWSLKGNHILLNNKWCKPYSDTIVEDEVFDNDSILIEIKYFSELPCEGCNVLVYLKDTIVSVGESNKEGYCVFPKTKVDSISVYSDKYRNEEILIMYHTKSNMSNHFKFNLTHDEYVCFKNEKWKIKNGKLRTPKGYYYVK